MIIKLLPSVNSVASPSFFNAEPHTYFATLKPREYHLSHSAAKNKGFTLIELLVVVLIIGILAAVALPQYTKAVEKSRAAEAFINIKAMAQAQKIHELETGTTVSPSSMDELSIDLPGTPDSNEPKARVTKYFYYKIGGTAGNTGVNIAYRGTTSAHNQMYALVSTTTQYSCCWYDVKYRQVCTSLGFTNPTDFIPIGAAIGCTSISN